MTVQWSPIALSDILQIYDYIAGDNQEAAAKVIERIRLAVEKLPRHPNMGRAGRVPGTRELVVGNYIIPYRFIGSSAEIISVIHGARRRKRQT